MRTARLPALLAVALSAAILVAAPVAAKDGKGTKGEKKQPARLATEVCEEMVSDAVEAAIGRKLPTEQVGEWTAPKQQYRCTYDLGGGSLVMTVDVTKTLKDARDAFVVLRKQSADRETLHGIGQQAFQVPDGSLIARKDNFVLHADPTTAPPGVNRRDVAFAAALGVMSCWP